MAELDITPSGSGGIPTQITVADTTDATSFVALFESATGDLAPKTDGALLYNASTGELTSTLFAGALNGTVGATTATTGVFTTATVNTGLMPDANDGAYLGQAGTAFSDLFLAEGGVINWDSGDATITQTGDVLMVAGAAMKWQDTSPVLITEAASSGTQGYAVLSAQDTTGAGQNVFTHAGGTAASPTATLDNYALGSFSFRGHTGSGYTGSKAYIAATATQDWTTTANGTQIAFSTTPNDSTTLTGALLLNNSQQVVAYRGFMPDANDGAYLGQSGTGFSDLFLAEGAVINWDGGDLTLTQTNNVLALGSGTFSIQEQAAAEADTAAYGQLWVKNTTPNELWFTDDAGTDFPISRVNGWTDANETWTYASASTFTVSGDVTTKYTKGTRLKWTQTTVKYGVVVASSYSAPNTTVTIAVNTDYTIANATITLNYFSYDANPQGYPGWFAFSTTWGGFSSAPTGVLCRYSITGNTCTLVVSTTGTGTSNSTSLTLTGPVAAAQTIFLIAWMRGFDNGAHLATPCQAQVAASSATINVWKTNYQNGWTSSGEKTVAGTIIYEF